MMMRHLIIGTAIAFALLSFAGCSQNSFEPFAQPNRRGPSLDSQLEAAAALRNPQDRDDAIAQVAKHAANVGDVHWATQALKAISDWEVRDGAALDVAVRLSKGGKDAAAHEIAGSIASSVVRDETLKVITKPK
jgi:hypothetical protein